MGASIGVIMTEPETDPCWPLSSSYYYRDHVEDQEPTQDQIYRDHHFDDVVIVRHDGPNQSQLTEYLKLS